MFWFFLRFIVLLMVVGCSQPKYHPPYFNFSEEWKTPQDMPTANADGIENWWEIFDDTVLNCLEEQAVAYNQDLFVAIARVWEARSLARVKGADLFPQIDFNALYNNSGMLFDTGTFFPGGGLIRIHQQQYQMTLDMNYQLDLWGKLRQGYWAAVFDAESVEYTYQSVLLSITSDLAAHYYTLRGLDSEIDVLEKTIELRKKALKVNSDRYNKGLVNSTDQSRAEVELQRAEADLQETRRRREIEENAIAILAGQSPVQVVVCYTPLDRSPPVIPAGMPSTLLLRRPDVIAAERDVAAAYARVGAAKADLFPAINLTGSLGFSSPDLDAFLTWQSRFWAIGATLMQTFFDAGRKEAQIDAAKAVNLQNIGHYRETILIALREVEDALVGLRYQGEQVRTLDKLVTAAQSTSDVTRRRYNSGLTNYLDVVQADNSLLEGQRQSVQVRAQQFLSTIQLIKAIGGCW